MHHSANFIMALTRDFQFLSTLNIEERTEDLCWLAVRYCGCALEWVPQQFKTAELCDLAIRTSSEGLLHIPEEFKTPELYLKAMQYWGDLKNVPENMKTYKICLAGVSHCGKNLEFVPTDIIDDLMYFIAVKHDKLNLRFVPEKLINASLIHFAFFKEKEDFDKGIISSDTIALYQTFARFLDGEISNTLSSVSFTPVLYMTMSKEIKTTAFQ